MGRGSRVNALLVEILMAVLFFALSATVILQCFSAAYGQLRRADARDNALDEAQNVVAALYVANEPEQALAQRGFVQADDWVLEGEGWQLCVALGAEASGAGTLETAQIVAKAGDEVLFELPAARYIPGEAVQ